MTTFGKIVMSLLVSVSLVGVYYGTATYVKEEETVTPSAADNEGVQKDTLTVASTSAVATETAENKKPSFTTILQQAGKQKCTISQPLGQMQSTGKVYIDGQRVRAEFSVTVMDKTINTTMIAKDGYMYSWVAGSESSGTKVKLGKSQVVTQGSSTESTIKTWNGDLVKEYSCENWNPDNNLFEVPENVIFKQVM